MDKNINPWITTVKVKSPTQEITPQTLPKHPANFLFVDNEVPEEGLHCWLEE